MSSWAHQALHITELVRRICEYLHNERRSLARLARTSKVFHEPAIASLWYNLPNIVPLVKCLPPDAWEVEDKVISLTRPLRPPDWTLFLRYAALVRELGMDREPWMMKVMRYRLHNEVIKRLAGLRPTIVLFPNVHELNWLTLGLDAESLQYLLSMIGDRLRTVSITDWPEGELAEHALIDCLPLIEARSSALQYLHVDADIAEPSSSIAFSSFVCNLVALVSMTATTIPINVEAAVALCQLPTLRSLRVWLLEGEKWPRNGSSSVASSSAVSLTVYATTHTYTLFSRAVSFPKLYAMELKIMEEPGPISELFNSVRRQCSPDSLRVLQISPKNWGRLSVATQSSTVVATTDFQPLFDFSGLNIFSFAAECRHRLTDTLFTSMAKAWPKLNSLHVSCEPYCAHEWRPSIHTLVSLAVHAPQLTHVGLHFDAKYWTDEVNYYKEGDRRVYETPADDFFDELWRTASMSEVVKLYVGRSPICQPHTVAYILARIFPKLEDIWPGPYGDVDETEASAANRKRWCEVKKLLPLFLKVRRDERRRIRQRLRNRERVEEEEEVEDVANHILPAYEESDEELAYSSAEEAEFEAAPE